jgi:hypothetical protein
MIWFEPAEHVNAGTRAADLTKGHFAIPDYGGEGAN